MKKILRDYLKRIGRKGGLMKTEKKAKAARENGKKNKGKKSILPLISYLLMTLSFVVLGGLI